MNIIDKDWLGGSIELTMSGDGSKVKVLSADIDSVELKNGTTCVTLINRHYPHAVIYSVSESPERVQELRVKL